MRRVRSVLVGSGFLALAVGVMTPAGAEEAKVPISASMMLNILAPAVAPRASAFDEAIKDPGPAPRSSAGEVQPDGSVRYGSGSRSVSVTVKNPCPPGTDHYEPPPLPGRRAR